MNIDHTNTERLLQTNHAEVSSLYDHIKSIDKQANIFQPEYILELDENEHFPTAACQHLEVWGLHHYYVPKELGGALDSFEILLWLLRLVASKDLTIAIGHGKTFLGASPVWVAGSDHLKKKVAKLIISHLPISLALTEKEHGSDLLSNSTVAFKDENKFILKGEKWLINNANRCAGLSVFCKTQLDHGPRSCSLFFVEKDHLSAKDYTHLNKIKTHGIRGADISGIRFNNIHLSSQYLIGQEGQGLEITMKALQISRTICTSLSLGAGDAALRLVLNYTLHRKLYSQKLYEIDYINKKLVRAYLDHLICEAISIAISRNLHVNTEQMSFYSAIVKYFVPVTTEDMLEELAQVLGSRQFLRQSSECGLFQKIQRDNSLVGLFDGSTIINLQIMAEQIKHIVRKIKHKTDSKTSQANEKIRNIFDISTRLPGFDYKRLKLSNHGNDLIMSTFDNVLVQLARRQSKANKTYYFQLEKIIGVLILERDTLFDQIMRLEPVFTKLDNHLENITKRYCLVFAACCYVHFWLFNAECMPSIMNNPNLLLSCLARLVMRLAKGKPTDDYINYDFFGQVLLAANKGDGLLTHFQLDSVSQYSEMAYG